MKCSFLCGFSEVSNNLSIRFDCCLIPAEVVGASLLRIIIWRAVRTCFFLFDQRSILDFFYENEPVVKLFGQISTFENIFQLKFTITSKTYNYSFHVHIEFNRKKEQRQEEIYFEYFVFYFFVRKFNYIISNLSQILTKFNVTQL